MVKCLCSECFSDNVRLSGSEKYLICRVCGHSEYIRDLRFELEEVREEE